MNVTLKLILKIVASIFLGFAIFISSLITIKIYPYLISISIVYLSAILLFILWKRIKLKYIFLLFSVLIVFILIEIGISHHYARAGRLMAQKMAQEIAQERSEQEAELQRRYEEFSSRDVSDFLALLEDNAPLFFVQLGRRNNNVNFLFEVKVENNTAILYAIDFVCGERIEHSRMVLNDPDFSSGGMLGDTFIFSLGNRNQFGHMLARVTFMEMEGDITIMIVYAGGAISRHPSNDINEILAELSDQRRETQLRYTGMFVFDRIEIVNNIGSSDDTFVIPFDEIMISFSETGNLVMWDGSDKTTGNSFYISNHDFPEFFGVHANGGGGYSSRYWYFDGDYLIFYSISVGGVNDVPRFIEYRIFYRIER